MANQTTADERENQSENVIDDSTISVPLRAEFSVIEQMLGAVTEEDVSELSDDEITALWSELKQVSDMVEDFRKDMVENEMRDRVEPGNRLSGVSRIESHNKYVAENASTVIGRAASRGIDYTEFVSLSASTIADEYPELADIGKAEYDYFR